MRGCMDEMSEISEWVKEIRKIANDSIIDSARGNKVDVWELINQLRRAAAIIESLSAKLDTANVNNHIVLYDSVCRKILQDIREKTFSVELADFYTESAVLFDDVEEIISSFAKEYAENLEWEKSN